RRAVGVGRFHQTRASPPRGLQRAHVGDDGATAGARPNRRRARGRSTMLTILLHMTVKPGREAECARVAAELTASTRAEDKGCISYTYYRRSDYPRPPVSLEHRGD